MIKKGDQTRAEIIDSARKIFSVKGYSATTMKDFCEETGLSRGGLYRHFSSTKEIMIAMLDSDIINSRIQIENVISSGMSPKEVLRLLLEDQKEIIKERGGDLELAMYEFCKSEKDQEHYINNRFTSSAEIIKGILKYGQERNEFVDCDANETAKRIIFLLEGIRISSSIMNLSEELLEEQVNGIFKMVVKL
ncbi:TetR/AcrR family transcriptional regulator [Clostridium sp. YIM B02505]|uniref:TetR/AcrR family transcriptional regulator n=1 Tax=Clostridium yunnanense TaxID=2800325 RepID=A0ABS1EN50_9CLOT|nr:TetR/AcrR family transcriptional regulator [Clostridium yunnanense]MBK1810796.1 TetR/AcrR family transcriptional regulator [Clostridium yunnanense]